MIEQDRIHLSLHIEKTAGTSFEKFLNEYYGSESVFLYRSDRDTIVCSSNILNVARLNKNVDAIRTWGRVAKITPIAHRFVLKVFGASSRGVSKIPDGCKVI